MLYWVNDVRGRTIELEGVQIVAYGNEFYKALRNRELRRIVVELSTPAINKTRLAHCESGVVGLVRRRCRLVGLKGF
jgi:hypothetical protein